MTNTRNNFDSNIINLTLSFRNIRMKQNFFESNIEIKSSSKEFFMDNLLGPLLAEILFHHTEKT